MNLSSESNSLPPAPRKPSRWIVGALWILAILMAAGVTRAYLLSHKSDDNPLHGDMDAATVGVADLMKKTALDKRMPLLKNYLKDSNPGVRYAAVDAMGDSGDPTTANDIENAFSDSASIVRQRALESLHKVDKERGQRLLLIGLRDEDKWIQEAAINQMVSGTTSHHTFIDKRAVPFLIQALDSPNDVVSGMAISPLRKLTGQPWKARSGMSAEDRKAVVQKWKNWWKTANSQYPISPELSKIEPIRPTRTDPAPDFHIKDLDGSEISLKEERGKVALLNFWGTWCPPCQQEIPDLLKLDTAYRDRGLNIIGIALGEDSDSSLRKWCADHGVRYRQSMSTQTIQDAYGHIDEVPVSVLIDKLGRVRYRWEGERDFNTFSSAVERLLKE